ncbi:MAG TPA: HlyD family efflux transporter periplasmic adaptor subunit [Candidatus Baltobacteraceae bacterium]|jgi:multidrug efflux pump subunit AcrA (membrane-fusion protein)
MKRSLPIVMALAVAGCHGERPVTHFQPTVRVVAARLGSLQQTLALAGRVGPAAGTQTKLEFSVPGTVRSIDVRLGDRVAAGTALAQLDPTSYSLAAQQAGADASAAIAGAAAARVDRVSVKLNADRAELERQRHLYRAGISALRDVQGAEATLAADRADSQAARAQIAQAQAQAASANARAASATYDVARTTLRAPHEGIVVAIFAQPGDAVDTTTPVVAIAPAEQHSATLDVPVSDVARVTAGDAVTMRAGTLTWSGRVSGVATAVDPATGLAVMSVDGIPSGVAAGTPVDATVVVGSVRGLIVPADAIVEDPQSGKTLAFVQGHDKNGATIFEPRTVTIDARNDSFVRVTSGLRAGERVAERGTIDLLAPPNSGGD